MCEQLAKDYASYVRVDVKTELRVVEETVDDMLARLDEFENLLSMVRADGAVCTDGALPKLVACKPQLDDLFGRVDRLGQLVARVDADLTRVEAAVVQAESDLSNPNSGKLKTFLKPLFYKSVTEAATKKPVRQTPSCDPDTLYNTEEFFPPGQDDPC